MSEPKVGEYWMHRGGPVKVCDVNVVGRFGVTYVQVVGERDGKPSVICGGHSFSWPAAEFSPITDPYLLAAVKIFEARETARDLKVKAARAEADEAKWQGVLEVLFDAAHAQGKSEQS